MPLYAKESLEALRQKIDLVEIVSSYVKMQRSGGTYKGLCPFHDEKTPSFVVHSGDSHYHCFGCGAHGDAIAFLMNHVKMPFKEALEHLSDRFQIPLEKVESEEKGPNKARLRLALDRACLWYHFFLLHSEEGHGALAYLYQRGLTLAFIRKFQLGYAPKQGEMLVKILRHEGFSEEELLLAGLLREKGRRDFFTERVTFPIRDRMGNVIGFSARKFLETTFGGKYINTSETPLFKKSQVLFGFCYSRQRMAKERKALIVEGQVDALCLIDAGFDYTVAGQGTAFGEGHVKEIVNLGVNHVYLALDADGAGKEATVKIGDLFQQKGVEVTVVQLPEGEDPDSFLRDNGKEVFEKKLQAGVDFLSFYYRFLCEGKDLSSPSQKNEVLETIAQRIRSWEHPVMVHESLKRLASLADVPEGALGRQPSWFVQKKKIGLEKTLIDPDRVLEVDLLRFLLLSKDKTPYVRDVVQKNLSASDFRLTACARLFSLFMEFEGKEDWIALASQLEGEEEQHIVGELLARSLNPFKIEEGIIEVVRKILEREWMARREQLHQQIVEKGSDEEVLLLTRQYQEISQHSPVVKV